MTGKVFFAVKVFLCCQSFSLLPKFFFAAKVFLCCQSISLLSKFFLWCKSSRSFSLLSKFKPTVSKIFFADKVFLLDIEHFSIKDFFL